MNIATKIASAVAGAAAAAIIAAAPADATPAQDAAFLSLVTNPPAGYQPLEFVSADVAVAQGKAVCVVLGDGYSLAATTAAVDGYLPVERSGAVTLVAAAVAVYCPWYAPASSSTYA